MLNVECCYAKPVGAGRSVRNLEAPALRLLLPEGEGARRADEGEGRLVNQGLANRQRFPLLLGNPLKRTRRYGLASNAFDPTIWP